MNSKTLKALKQSIKHWERLVAGEPGEEMGRHTCALCKLFRPYKPTLNCLGCPVAVKTGKPGCQSTPYDVAANAFVFQGKHSKTFNRAAKKELAFLKSLLPK